MEEHKTTYTRESTLKLINERLHAANSFMDLMAVGNPDKSKLFHGFSIQPSIVDNDLSVHFIPLFNTTTGKITHAVIDDFYIDSDFVNKATIKHGFSECAIPEKMFYTWIFEGIEVVIPDHTLSLTDLCSIKLQGSHNVTSFAFYVNTKPVLPLINSLIAPTTGKAREQITCFIYNLLNKITQLKGQ